MWIIILFIVAIPLFCLRCEYLERTEREDRLKKGWDLFGGLR